MGYDQEVAPLENWACKFVLMDVLQNVTNI